MASNVQLNAASTVPVIAEAAPKQTAAMTIAVFDRLNGVAVGSFQRDLLNQLGAGLSQPGGSPQDFLFYPTINGKRIKSVRKIDLGFSTKFQKLTYEVATKKLIKITAESPDLKFCWYAEKCGSDPFYTARPYIPQENFSLQDALPKFCTLIDRHPSFTITSAIYNSEGVGVFGRDDLCGDSFFCWGSPSDCTVDIVSSSRPRIRDNVKLAGTWDDMISFEDDGENCFLNSQKAKRIDLKKIFQDFAELQKMKADLLSRILKVTQASGIEVINKTGKSVSVLLRDSESNLMGRKTYDVRIDDKALIPPNTMITSGVNDGRVVFYRSVKMTFDLLENNIVSLTEVDNRNTETSYVDMNIAINNVAHRMLRDNPFPSNFKSSTFRTIDAQIAKSNIPISTIEVVVNNIYGTIVLVKGANQMRSFYYGIHPADLKENADMTNSTLQLNHTLRAFANHGMLGLQIDYLSNAAKTVAWINLYAASVIRPEALTFRRGVQQRIEELERKESRQVLPLDLWDLTHEYAMWNEFSDVEEPVKPLVLQVSKPFENLEVEGFSIEEELTGNSNDQPNENAE